MELDPLKLLCSGNPLDSAISALKSELEQQIKAAVGSVTSAITDKANELKEAFEALLPPFPDVKPSFLLELQQLKDSIGEDIVTYTQKTKAFIEKWGTIVSDIETIIANLANLNVCDLMRSNYKLNPDGTAFIEAPPALTASGPPEKSAPAEVTMKNNLPEGFATKTAAATDAGKAITQTIESGELYQLKISSETNLEAIVSSAAYTSFVAKCQGQGVSLDNTAVQNLSDGERAVQHDYIVYSKDIEEVNAAVNACKLSAVKANEQFLQKIKATNGTISSEEVDAILNSVPSLVTETTLHTVKTPAIKDAMNSTAAALKSSLTASWIAFAERSAMQAGINHVEVIKGQKFAEWFNSQGFKHFTADEFTNYFSRPLNQTPSPSLWPNVVSTLRLVDELADALGGDVTITSSYRSPEYNRNVGGKIGSFHLVFNALDIQVSGKSPQSVYNTLLAWRNQGRFRGGLGLYSTFVHVDTRGSNATW